MRLRDGVRAVAVFEASKGALVLLAGCGLLSLIHHSAQQIAEQLVGHLHLNPASRYSQIFIDAAAALTEPRVKLLALGAAAYALARFIEAYGLWRSRRWAHWFAAISAAIYIPFELYGLRHHVDGLTVGALAMNVLVVALMARALLR
jgi:uncharacterized membrane protein (DUF2068 family)